MLVSWALMDDRGVVPKRVAAIKDLADMREGAYTKFYYLLNMARTDTFFLRQDGSRSKYGKVDQ